MTFDVGERVGIGSTRSKTLLPIYGTVVEVRQRNVAIPDQTLYRVRWDDGFVWSYFGYDLRLYRGPGS